SASLFLSGSLIVNDVSTRSLEGVDVDSAIDPFQMSFSSEELPFLKTDHKLIASGVRSVTFLRFKVYGVGIYISAKDEPKLVRIIQEFLKEHPVTSLKSLLADKQISQQVVDKISQQVPYAVRITPIRNTDFGHMKDGLTKSILANPMTQVHREEISKGVEQLRNVFQGFKGLVPKNKTMWVVSDTKSMTLYNTIKDIQKMGEIQEPLILRVLLVSYLSNLQPLSESLRQNFASYAST
ncbi:hypothetical protein METBISCDRAFT_4171, partial [Metschnikowia bicuspidata]